MPAVTIKFDPREMQAALQKLSIVSDKLPSELVNQKSYRVFQKAVWWMKVVPRATITDELGASAAHVLTPLKSGKFSRAKKNVRMFFGQGAGDTAGFPLAAAIIQARAGHGGKPSPFKGKTREAGAEAMRQAMAQLFAARLRSIGYFKSMFATVRDVFKGAGTGRLARDKGRLADAVPAKKNVNKALATFWMVSPKHDLKDALDQYAAPVLQDAFNEEGEETFKHAAELEYKQAIKALGIRVT